MTPLQQFNSMIQFYCSAHSGDADVVVFNNNGRTVTRVDHSDWVFAVKINQDKPEATLRFTSLKDDTVDSSVVSAPNYNALLPLILAFHFRHMSEVH